MKLLIMLLFIGYGRETYIGSRDLDVPVQNPVTATQLSQCHAPTNQEIFYMGVPCRFQFPVGQNYQYRCANNRIIIMDCQGNIL